MGNLLQGIGQAQPVSQFIDTALKYQTTQAHLENQRVQQQMLQQQMAQMEKDNKEYNADAALSLYPEHIRPQLKEMLTLSGKIRPDGMVVGKDMRDVPKLLEQYPKISIGINNIEYERLAKENKTLSTKGDQESQQKMMKNVSEMTDIKKKIDFLSGKESKKLTVAAPGSDVLGPEGEVLHSVPAKAPPDNSETIDIRRNQQEETARHNREMERLNAEKAKSGAMKQDLSFADKEAIRAMGKQLPKSKVAAETAMKNIQKIDRMIALVNQGAGGVRGDILAKANKAADVLRVTSPEDAKYNTLKAEMRGFAGQIRLQLGLVGQTSDRDVAIMYEAAGGGSPAESQKAILAGYRQAYQQDVDNYNSDVQAYSENSKLGGKLFKPVGVNAGPSVAERRTLKSGEVWEKLSDGTFRKVK